MTISNINSINNPNDFNLTAAQEEYLLQALANLGQRYNIKGDGIEIGTVTFAELIGFDGDTSNKIGKIYYSNDHSNVILGYVNKDTFETIQGEITIPNSNYCTATLLNDKLFEETSLNNCEHVNIYSDEHNVVFSLLENLDNSQRFVCYKYNKYTNQLLSGLIIANTGNESEGFNNTIIYVSKNGETTDTISYVINIYEINTDENLVINSASGVETHFTLEDIAAKFIKVNTSELTSLYDMDFTPESLIAELHKALQTSSNYAQIFKKTDIIGVQASYSKSNGTFTTATATLNPYMNIIQTFEYDRTYIYRAIKEYYSKNYYSDGVDSKTLLKKVLKGLLSLIYNSDYEETELYVPLEYKFEYAYNTNDPWQIYFSTHDIAVRYSAFNSNLVNKETRVFNLNDDSGLICLTKYVERVNFFNYSIEYENNESSNDNIYGIHVIKSSELPYINKFGYWVINGVDTEVYARGKDAGNPNIVIVDSDTSNGEPRILTGADINFLTSLDWVAEHAYIKLPRKYKKTGTTVVEADAVEPGISNYFKSIVNNNVTIGTEAVECQFLVPSLNNVSANSLEEYVDKLKYAIFVNITSINSIIGYGEGETVFDNKVKEIFRQNGKLCSIWTLEEDTLSDTGYSFKCKTDITGYAVDFNYLCNMDNLVGWAISNYIPEDPDNYLYTQVVFDDANKQLKQLDENETKYSAFPTMHNLSPMSNGQYSNQFNFIIEYLDNIESQDYIEPYDTSEDNPGSSTYQITSISQSNRRYINEWKTNHSVKKYYDNASDYLPSDQNHGVPILDLGEVLIKDNTVINRTNVVSFDASGTSYYSYLGTRYDDTDKSVLVLGTSNTNMNLGSRTLASDKSIFETQRQFNINFDNTRISSYAYIGNDAIFEKDTITYRTNWTRHDIDGITYWNTIYRPVGMFDTNEIILNVDSAKASEISSINNGETINTTADMLNNLNEDGIFIKCSIYDRYTSTQLFTPFCIGDAISLSYLVKTIMPQIDFDNIVEITSNKEVITLNNTYKLLKVSSAFSTKEIYLNKVYTAMPLSITYYAINDNIYMNIEEDNTYDTFGTLFKINSEYTE